MDQAMIPDFETSPGTAALDAQLAKAQGAFKAAIKDKVNPHFRSKYADLASVWEACREALSANGVSVTQWPIHSDDGRMHLITRLAAGGEWMKAHFSIPVSKQDAHGYGSAITYLKRFALAAALGIASDDDDDGNAAVAKGATATDPIQAAREEIEAERGPSQNQYRADRAAKAAKWTDAALATVGKLPTEKAIGDWWDANESALTKLETEHPALHERLVTAIDKRRDEVPMTMQA